MDKILSAIQPYISLVKDLVTIASIGIAGYVALRGLQAWRDQLKGTSDYQLAKRLLKATYQLRNALQRVREPFIKPGEFAYAVKEAQLDIKSSDKDFHAASTAAVYQMRWKPVVEASQALDLEALEAETVWGPDVRAAITTIWINVNTLNNALGAFLEDMGSPFLTLDEEYRKHFRSIVYSVTDDPENDPYLKSLTSAIKVIEEIAHRYITK
ncbi:MAG: hypothetical protein ABSG01_14225 [Anaerolineales bacterium]|jgi:hypothetical protein